MNEFYASILQVVVAVSVLYVWVLRYDVVVTEFAHFKLPDALRDVVGVLKIAASLVLLGIAPSAHLEVLAALTITAMMLAALAMHIRVRNPIHKMLPSFSLGLGAIVIVLFHLGRLG